MPRGTQRQPPAVASQPATLTAHPTEATQPRATADNSFDSVPTDISDSTSRSRSGEPVTTTSMDSSSSATGASAINADRKWFSVLPVYVLCHVTDAYRKWSVRPTSRQSLRDCPPCLSRTGSNIIGVTSRDQRRPEVVASSATGAATAGSGGGGSLDTDSTDKSASAGSHKLHQMRDDSGYKSLETQQSLGKSGIGVATASLLARIGTRSMDRAPPGLVSQPAAVVGRAQYSLEVSRGLSDIRKIPFFLEGLSISLLDKCTSAVLPASCAAVRWKSKVQLTAICSCYSSKYKRLADTEKDSVLSPMTPCFCRVQYSLEVPNVPVQFAATSPKLKDIVVPVPQLPVHDVKTTQHHPYEETTTSTTKTFGHSALTEFFAGISSTGSGSGQAEDSQPKKQHIPFVPETAFLEKFAERTQTVGRALTSSFDRIRQQAGSFLSRTSAVVRGASDAEAPTTHPVGSPFRRASSSEFQSATIERESRLQAVADPYHRRSNSGEVFTADSQAQYIGSISSDAVLVMCGGKLLHPSTVMPTSSGIPSPRESARDDTAFASIATASGSTFVGPETVLATTTTMTTPSMTVHSPRHEVRDVGKEVQTGSHQLLTADVGYGSTHRPDRSAHGTKPGGFSFFRSRDRRKPEVVGSG